MTVDRVAMRPSDWRTVMTPFKTILVPIDFSPGSIAAAQRAHELASVFHSHVHLLHVVAPPDIPLSAVEPSWGELWALHRPTRMEALDRLATLVAEQRFDPFTTTGLVRTGRAEQVISMYAGEVKADLIVMGIHGDHAQPVGETVERVLGRTQCAVLAVPAPTLREMYAESTPTALQPVAC
jgi:CPA2 family monovalent cation:H+ antiporter-2